MVKRAFAVVVTAAFLSGCGDSGGNVLGSHIGESCTVQFRRGDALGSGANLPVPPTTGSMNGADVATGGTLKSVSRDWIVIHDPATRKDEYIPTSGILMVTFDSP